MRAFRLSGIAALALLLATEEVDAQAITLTPTGATMSVGQTRQFTATGIDIATALGAGAFHQCALLEGGEVRCWGFNDFGQLGNGTHTFDTTPGSPNPTPVEVIGIAGAVEVSGGGHHTCARLAGGTLQCWGFNNGDPNGGFRSGGQLGHAAVGNLSPTPRQVTGITTAAAVTAGGYHTCALLQNGTVQCWGQNDQGQLGNGTLDPAPPAAAPRNATPVTVLGIGVTPEVEAVAVSAGGWHTCALLRNGTVRCWGDNQRGAVGNGNPAGGEGSPRKPTPTPVEVVGVTTAVAIKAGVFHTCALLQDGTVRCWGWNTFGQLGNDPPAINSSSIPVTVSGIMTPAALAPGAEHTCVLLQDGTVLCWGDHSFGQHGNGSPAGEGTLNPGNSAPVKGITTATAVTSGAEHACALLLGGRVQCWGRGLFGRLGHGAATDADASSPVDVVGLGVEWTSSDPTVATIDATALTTALSPGSTTITARSGDRSGSTTLTVVPPGTGGPTLAVVRTGTGGGTVTSSEAPPRINCGTTCSASYDRGTTVTLTATPDPGSVFKGWRVGGLTGLFQEIMTVFGWDLGFDGIADGTALGGGCSGTGPCTVTVSADTTIFARFSVSTVTLSVTSRGFGDGSVTSSEVPPKINCGTTCSASYDRGATVTLTATPAPGSVFRGWRVGSWPLAGLSLIGLFQEIISVFDWDLGIDGIADGTTLVSGCSGAGPCTVTLTARTTVAARFADVTAPVPSLPGNIVTTATGPLGAVVTFAASASDNADPSPRVLCSPGSGSLFSIGTTTVTCWARDDAGNSARGSFLVTVLRHAPLLSSGGPP